LAAALFLGLTRESAARFVFLMAAPITAGAGLFQLRHLASGGVPADERAAFVIGIAASFAVGMFAIGVLLRYLRTHNLDIFVVYRIALGVLVLLLAALRVR
jgi:undecaprenyl-diphosphatase